MDLWNGGAPANPLALDDRSDRAIDTAVIELRDTVEEATRSFTRMGVHQKAKLEKALREAYASGKGEGRWPTLRTLDDHLDADLAGVMGDLTLHQLFKAGEPLGNVIDHNVVFGLSKISGNGPDHSFGGRVHPVRAALLRVQNLPPVPNTIRYVAVVDKAHRGTDFQAVKTMIREGRSKASPSSWRPSSRSTCPTSSPRTPRPNLLRPPRRDRGGRWPPASWNRETRGSLNRSGLWASAKRSSASQAKPPRLVRMAHAYRDAEALGLLALRQPQ